MCTYLSLQGALVQLQVLFGGSLLHELRAQLVDLVSAAAHAVRHHLGAALLLLQLQLQALQFVLAERRGEEQSVTSGRDQDEGRGCIAFA